MAYDIDTEGCPICDGSGTLYVALDNEGDVAKEQCPICIQLKKRNTNHGKKED